MNFLFDLLKAFAFCVTSYHLIYVSNMTWIDVVLIDTKTEIIFTNNSSYCCISFASTHLVGRQTNFVSYDHDQWY